MGEKNKLKKTIICGNILSMVIIFIPLVVSI